SALALYGAQKAPTIIAVAIPVVSFGLPILETSLSVLRRFISGRPVFTADREHIHHKLLQRGMSHRQVVIVLYGVSAVFALLSLPLVTAGRQLYGNLIIFRRYANRDLQLDINLLTSIFATTLAEALHRTTRPNVEFMPANQDPALLPAQAG